MITSVELRGNAYYSVDENNKDIAYQYEISLGILIAYTSEFIVFKRNGAFYTFDERFNGIAYQYEASLGEFKSASGSTMNFKRGGNVLYTYDKYFREKSYRYI